MKESGSAQVVPGDDKKSEESEKKSKPFGCRDNIKEMELYCARFWWCRPSLRTVGRRKIDLSIFRTGEMRSDSTFCF